MIVPMKKVCLLVQERYQHEALNKLREVGVVHVEKTGAGSEGLSRAIERKARVEEAINLIQPYKPPKKKPHSHGEHHPVGHLDRRAIDKAKNGKLMPYSLDAVNGERPDLVQFMLGFGKQRKALEEHELFLVREIARLTPWGEFDPAKLREQASLGQPVFLYELSLEAFAALPQEVRYIKISQGKTFVRLLVLDEEIPGTPSFPLPEKSLSQYQAELEETKKNQQELLEKIKSFADRRNVLKKEMTAVENDINFETTLAGLLSVEGTPPEHGISYLKGYLPADELPKLQAVAKENSWALACDDPAPDVNPPTLLRNNPLVRLIQPLFSFLGTIPGYREFDISAPYLVFFSLFFAMIFGDAAYGLLIFGVSFFFALKIKRNDGGIPDVLKLFMLLGICTVVWGAINGNWFAIPRDSLPIFMKALIIPPFNNAGPLVAFPGFLQTIFKLPAEVPMDELKTRWSIQFLCFTVAVIQLTLARGTRIKKLFPSLSAFAQVGWFLMMLGLYFVVLSIMLNIPLPPFVPHLLIGGVSFILIFGEQRGGNFVVNIAKGLGGSFSLFLKLVSCFADILSYIRLFAVGLAGSMIGQVFNSLAMPGDGFGSFGLIFLLKLVMTIAILIFGHGLNIALTAMSVVVHGVRLNLLEFAGNHLEMEWSGYEYNPFALKQKN